MDDRPKGRDRKCLFLQLPHQSNPSPSRVSGGTRKAIGRGRTNPASRTKVSRDRG
jgi:hypothetical protein